MTHFLSHYFMYNKLIPLKIPDKYNNTSDYKFQ